jgi:hypothetical protein
MLFHVEWHSKIVLVLYSFTFLRIGYISSFLMLNEHELLQPALYRVNPQINPMLIELQRIHRLYSLQYKSKLIIINATMLH